MAVSHSVPACLSGAVLTKGKHGQAVSTEITSETSTVYVREVQKACVPRINVFLRLLL